MVTFEFRVTFCAPVAAVLPRVTNLLVSVQAILENEQHIHKGAGYQDALGEFEGSFLTESPFSPLDMISRG